MLTFTFRVYLRITTIPFSEVGIAFQTHQSRQYLLWRLHMLVS